MSTVNASTGFSPFQLRMGQQPRLIPPLTTPATADAARDLGHDATRAAELLARIAADFAESQDNLLAAKLSQADAANQHRGPERRYAVGDRVLLSTYHRRRDYKAQDPSRVAK
ncbi:hypothetical protein FA95DRAFT_1457006, partial [Auriscalpium vulgare]